MQRDRDEVTATELARTCYPHQPYLSPRGASDQILWEKSCRDCGPAWGCHVQIPFGKESVCSRSPCPGLFVFKHFTDGVLGREPSFNQAEQLPHDWATSLPLNPKQISGGIGVGVCWRESNSLQHPQSLGKM